MLSRVLCIDDSVIIGRDEHLWYETNIYVRSPGLRRYTPCPRMRDEGVPTPSPSGGTF
jgi:hypothetical protein